MTTTAKQVLKTSAIIAGFLAVCVSVLWITFAASDALPKSPSEQANDACVKRQPGVVHQVSIRDGNVDPLHTSGKLCDRLTITNLDDASRLVAFGQHADHVAYDGVGEKLLSQGQSLTVTLNEPGNFLFHDHLQDQVRGYFTVKN